MIMIFFIMFLRMLLMIAATLTCQQYNGGTLFFIVSNNRTCEEYSWKVNGDVVAHDRDVNKTLVLNHGPLNITFRSCLANVIFTCNKDTRVACTYNCSTKSVISGKVHEENGAIFGGILAVIFIIIIIITIMAWWKKDMLKQCGRPERDAPV